MKRERFKWSDIYKPTKESIAEQNRRHALYEYYGIPIGMFTSNSFEYTKTELEAMSLIGSNKKIPEELEKELLRTKQERQLHREQKFTNKQPEYSLVKDKEFQDYIKSKLK